MSLFKMKILVIDDSGLQRKLISQIIRKAGFDNEIMEAGDGQQAIQLLGTNFNEIGLILCDWNMPNMNEFSQLSIQVFCPITIFTRGWPLYYHIQRGFGPDIQVIIRKRAGDQRPVHEP